MSLMLILRLPYTRSFRGGGGRNRENCCKLKKKKTKYAKNSLSSNMNVFYLIWNKLIKCSECLSG